MTKSYIRRTGENMSKKKMEIGVTTVLVFIMIALMVLFHVILPESLRSAGVILSILLFMVLMGGAGIRLMEIEQ